MRQRAGFPGAEAFLDRDAFWGIESDILIPAALEQQITAANAPKIRTKSSWKAPTARPRRKPTTS
jgi:glutamate dehydrogenase/leucine dehydrogenase